MVIKMGQPSAARALWGDFYYGYSLKKSLRRLGWDARVAFRDELHRPAEREIVLLGLEMDSYVPSRDSFSIAWLISHPDRNTPEVLSRYRKAYVASRRLSSEWGFEFLGQAFDSDVYYPSAQAGAEQFPVTFVGHPRAGDRTELLNTLDQHINEFHVWGDYHCERRNWHGRVPWLRSGEVYRSSSIVVGHNTAAARHAGVANDRMHSVMACGTFLLSDHVSGIGEVFPELVCYETPRQAVELCLRYLGDRNERQRIARLCMERNQRESFDQRASVIHQMLSECDKRS